MSRCEVLDFVDHILGVCSRACSSAENRCRSEKKFLFCADHISIWPNSHESTRRKRERRRRRKNRGRCRDESSFVINVRETKRNERVSDEVLCNRRVKTEKWRRRREREWRIERETTKEKKKRKSDDQIDHRFIFALLYHRERISSSFVAFC